MDRPPTLRTLGTVSPGCAFSMFSGTEQRCSSYRKPSCALDGRVTFLSPVVLYSFPDGVGAAVSSAVLGRCRGCAAAVPGCGGTSGWRSTFRVPQAGRDAQLSSEPATSRMSREFFFPMCISVSPPYISSHILRSFHSSSQFPSSLLS